MSVSATSSGNSQLAAAGSPNQDKGKIEKRIEEIKKKIRQEEQSFDGAREKKEKIQHLETQLSQQEAQVQQIQQSNPDSDSTNNAKEIIKDPSSLQGMDFDTYA